MEQYIYRTIQCRRKLPHFFFRGKGEYELLPYKEKGMVKRENVEVERKMENLAMRRSGGMG
jgi:hypothetical protein